MKASNPSSGVTIGDLLAGLHYSLAVEVQLPELQQTQSEELVSRILDTADWRYKELQEKYGYQGELTILRSDFLLGQTRFGGIFDTKQGQDQFLLCTMAP